MVIFIKIESCALIALKYFRHVISLAIMTYNYVEHLTKQASFLYKSVWHFQCNSQVEPQHDRQVGYVCNFFAESGSIGCLLQESDGCHLVTLEQFLLLTS